MNWPLSDPGAGEVSGIRYLARVRTAKAEALRGVSLDIRRSLRVADSGIWVGAAQVAFVAKAESVLPDLALLAEGLDSQSAALLRYASEISQIQDALRGVRHQQSNAEGDLGQAQRVLLSLDHEFGLGLHVPAGGSSDSGPTRHRVNPADSAETAVRRARTWAHADEASARLRQAERACDELVSRRRRADQVCAGALSSEQVRGRLGGVSPASLNGMTAPQVLAFLQTLSATDLSVLLANNPELAQRFWSRPPDATVVAAWWSALPTAEKSTLIVGAAAIIGNLGGVDYASRITANLQQIADAKRRGGLTAAQRAAIAQIENALEGHANRGLIDLNLASIPPLAAIAIGNMDTAHNVTWAIPGMNTTVASSMTDWTGAAQNLYSSQGSAGAESRAVVAWIGYRPPELLESLLLPGSRGSVWENDLAGAGATRLASELDAFHDTRAFDDGGAPPFVAVVAHSYGTTTSAYALQKIGFTLDSAVFLGSAGIDRGVIPTASELKIAMVNGKEQLYSTQAELDHVATVGRLPAMSNGAVYSNRVNPDAEFGAIPFSSEGGDDGAVHYLVTDGHDAIGEGPPGATVGHGYFDRGTESLHDAAFASIGRGEDIKILTHPQAPPHH